MSSTLILKNKQYNYLKKGEYHLSHARQVFRCSYNPKNPLIQSIPIQTNGGNEIKVGTNF